MIRRAALLGATTFAVATSFAPAAQASTIDGPSSPCSVTATWSKPSSGTVKVTWKTECKSKYYMISNGMTVQRPGKTETHSAGCRTAERTVKVCTKSVTISDPAGTQQYESINEVFIDDSYYDMDGASYGWRRSTYLG